MWAHERNVLVAQVMAGVPVRVLDQVVLMVFFRARKWPGIRDLGRYRGLPPATGLRMLNRKLGNSPLFRAGHEDCGTILSSDVIVLPVLRRRIVHAEEPLLQQVRVGELLWVEYHAHGFSMTRIAP